jgi:hypothetical protein
VEKKSNENYKQKEDSVNYWELRAKVAKIVPRMTQLYSSNRKSEIVREKGRKKNYSQFNLRHGEWRKQERLLNTEEINSFLEISVRAAACPMPFNMDIWDGLVCIVKGQLITTKNGKVMVEEIEEGDIVLSYDEKEKEIQWKPVIKKSSTIKQKYVEFETELGLLKVTEDHRIFTQRGWIEARNIQGDDLMYSYEER